MAEERLAYLTGVVESSDDAIFGLARDGGITSWNRAAERLYGYTALDIIGTRASVLAPAEHQERFSRLFERVIAGERLEHVELQHERRDGMAMPVSVTMSPVTDGTGGMIGICVIVRDLTESRETQATLASSEERLREGEALAHVGGWTWDTRSGAVQWSDELHRIFARDPLEFEGDLETHLGCFHPDDRERIREAMYRAVEAGGDLSEEGCAVRPDGDTRWVYLRAKATAGATNEVIGLRGICQDITHRHDAEVLIEEAYERERAAAEELRAADRLKDQFLATVSHELRTPLTVILGFAELLETAKRADQKVMIGAINRNADEMRRMIDGMLDLSRLQAGKVQMRPVAVGLGPAIEESVRNLATLLCQHEVVVAIPSDLRAVADGDGLQRIIVNLIVNAAKFSPPGSRIDVGAARAQSEVLLTIDDQGPGVPSELRERVFEPFFQRPFQAPGRHGTGIGLSIVRQYAELLGGRVWCDASDAGGARFVVALPAQTE